MQNTQQIPDELICPITRDWLEDPISLPCCGRAFSRQSIVACLAGQVTHECPMCRQSLHGFDVNTAPKSVNIAYMVEQARSGSVSSGNSSSTLPPIPPKPEAKWTAKLYKLQNNNSAYQSVIGKLEVSNSNNAVTFKTLLVPVIDRSGSMAGNPIKQAQYSLNRIVDLTYQYPNLCTSVVAYDDGGQTLKLNTALSIDQNKASIATMLAKSGGTSFKAAFDEVLKICKDYNNVSEVTSVVIIFLTDGQDSSPAENGRAALVNSFKTSITQCWKKQFTVHTVGFGGGHDYAFLNNLRQIGTSEGAYRYADPNEDSDSLSNKIHSVLNVVVKSSSVPLELLPHPTIPVISGDNGKYWVDLTNDTTNPVVDPSQGYKFQISVNKEPAIEVVAELVEVHDDTTLWNDWYTYLIDEIASEILTLSQATSTTQTNSLDREIHYEYLLQRGRAIASRLVPDSPNVERLSKLMDSVKTIQAGGQVNQSKLNDMKFEGKYATSGQTSTVGSGPIKVLDSVIPPQQWTSGFRGSNWPIIKRPYLKRGRKCPQLFGGRDNGILERSQSNTWAKNLIANKPGWLTAVDADGFNSLMVASSIGRCAVITYLLDSGLFNDPSILNKPDKNGYNALDLAILYGHWRTYEILRGVGAKPNQDGNLLLRTCLSAGHFNLADRLYKDKFCQVDTDMVENAPVKCLDWLNKHSATELSLETAIAKGVYDRVEKEVNAWSHNSATISWKSFTELFTKPSADHLRIVELLLKNKRADANEQIHITVEGVDEVTWPLFMAAEKGQLAMVKLLLKHVAKDTIKDTVNQQNLKGTTCLWIACCNRHIDVVTLLLDKGADPNLANFKGDSPLIPCCQKGSDALVEILLDCGADLGAYNKNRDNPVIICCRIGQAKILEILLKRVKGTELKSLLEGCAQIDGFNPLLAAAEADKADCIRVCHKYGADLEFRSADDNVIIAGATALHLACFYGKMNSVRTLCELGADVFSQTTVNGWTPLHIAIKQGHSQVVQYLLNMSKERAVKMLTLTDKDGKTPKYYVSSGMLDEFFTNKLAVAFERVLLADPETQMRCAQTMVKYGRSMGCYDYNETTDLLIDGQSVLTQALLNSSVPLLSSLKQMGADPFLKDDYGMSPLFWSLYLSNQGQNNVSSGALTLLNNNIPIPDDLKVMLDRVKGVQSSSLQNRMLTNVSGGRPLLTQENRVFANPLDNLLKMNDGYPLTVGDGVVSTLKDESLEDQSLLGFIEKLRSNKVFPDGKQFLDHVLWDAKVHIIRMLAGGETRLQPIHLMALYLYTGNSTIYKQVNMTMSKWDQNSVWHPFICCLYQAIGLLPEYKAEAYRAVESGVFNLTDYAIGKKVEWNTFSMASSEWKGSAELINARKGIIFIIKSLTGRQIGRYSKCPADAEVIFLPGTKFEITDHYVGKVFVLGQANIRKTSYRMKDTDYDKALKGDMCTIIELAEINESVGHKGTTITV